MHIEDKTGQTIKIMVPTFGNQAGDFVEITDSDQKGVFYKDSKGKRCRFLHTQAGMMFRYEDPTDKEIKQALEEAAETAPEPESGDQEEGEAVKETADEPVEEPEEAPKKAKSKK